MCARPRLGCARPRPAGPGPSQPGPARQGGRWPVSVRPVDLGASIWARRSRPGPSIPPIDPWPVDPGPSTRARPVDPGPSIRARRSGPVDPGPSIRAPRFGPVRACSGLSAFESFRVWSICQSKVLWVGKRGRRRDIFFPTTTRLRAPKVNRLCFRFKRKHYRNGQASVEARCFGLGNESAMGTVDGKYSSRPPRDPTLQISMLL